MYLVDKGYLLDIKLITSYIGEDPLHGMPKSQALYKH